MADLKDFVLVVKDIQEKTPIAFPLQGIIMRFSGNSDIHMSTAYQRDTAHIEFFVVKRENPYDDATGNLAGYQTIAQTLVLLRRGDHQCLQMIILFCCRRQNVSQDVLTGVKVDLFSITGKCWI